MKKFYSKEQLEGVRDYPVAVINSISETIEILDNNYGANRNVESDLGGYVLIAENIAVIEMLKQDKLQGLIPEYTDVIVVVTTEELSKFLLE